MAFELITSGAANPVITNLENHFMLKTTGYRHAGLVAALMSPQNRAGELTLLQRDAIEGYRKEFFLRFKKNAICDSTELSSAAVKSLDACDTTDGISLPSSWVTESVEFDESLFSAAGKKLVFDPAAFNNEWGNSMIQEQTRVFIDAIEDAVKVMDKTLFPLVRAAAGGYMDSATGAVTAAGTTRTFTVLNEYGALLGNFADQWNRFLRWNDMGGTPMVVMGDNALASFAALKTGGAFSATDQGLNLDALANQVGFLPYLDTIGQMHASLTAENSLLLTPGSARLVFDSDFLADTVMDTPLYKRYTVTGPMGIPFEWEWKFHDCGTYKGKWVTVMRTKYRLLTQPDAANHCELAGTNGIIKADFTQCAPVGCPESV